jgi:hypothetical protein
MSSLHDVSYCQSVNQSISIELVVHGNQLYGEDNSPFRTVFSGKLVGDAISDDKITNIGNHINNCEVLSEIYHFDVKLIWLLPFNVTCYYLNRGVENSTTIECVVLESINLAQSIYFWSNLGFVVISEGISCKGKSWCLLHFKSILKSLSMHLVLIQQSDKRNEPYKLDMPGFTCLALLTKNIAEEVKLLVKNKINVSNICCLMVGGHLLKMCFLYGPEGECIELIQFCK